MKPPLLLRLAFLPVACAAAGPASAAETQTVASFKHTITKIVGYDYLLSLPTGYDAGADRLWPVILFLHGAGERGSDPWLVTKHGPPKLIRGEVPAAAPAPGVPPPPAESAEARARREQAAARLKADFVVVSPQCPASGWWDDDAVLALLDEIAAKYKIDPRRVYLTGLSMGGYGTWSVGVKYPERFAAIVPICGSGQYLDAYHSAHEKKAAFVSLGVWAFHGAKDPTVPVAESEKMVATLKQFGVTDVQLTIYPEAMHDSWTETYANPELYSWLLRHQR